MGKFKYSRETKYNIYASPEEESEVVADAIHGAVTIIIMDG